MGMRLTQGTVDPLTKKVVYTYPAGKVKATQFPQQLPRQVLSLCNNFILHKLTDPQVVNLLRHTVSGIDESLWARLPGLAPGQAIVSFGHMTRPLLASIDTAGRGSAEWERCMPRLEGVFLLF